MSVPEEQQQQQPNDTFVGPKENDGCEVAIALPREIKTEQYWNVLGHCLFHPSELFCTSISSILQEQFEILFVCLKQL